MWLELWREFYPNDVVTQVVNVETWLTEDVSAIPKDFRKEEDWQFTFESISKDDLYWYFDFRVLSSSWISASKELNKQNSLQLLDRAVTAWVNPQTWEEYVDKKGLWKHVLQNFNFNPSELMWANSEQQQQAQDVNKQAFDQQQWLDQQAQQWQIDAQQQWLNQWLAQWPAPQSWWQTLSQTNAPTANLSGINAPSAAWIQNVSPNQQ